MAKKLGNVFLFLVVLLASCSINCVFSSPQESLPLIELRRKMIIVGPSTSRRANKRDIPPLPPPDGSSSPPASPLLPPPIDSLSHPVSSPLPPQVGSSSPTVFPSLPPPVGSSSSPSLSPPLLPPAR